MGLITPKNGDEMYLEVQRYLASIMTEQQKIINYKALLQQVMTQPENIQAANALIDAQAG